MPASIHAAHGRDGIEVQSPFADVAAFARQVKVALFPLRYGTGQSNKVLEAAEGGCAVVATRTAMRGLDSLKRHALIANDAGAFARSAIIAISDESRRAAMVKGLRGAVEASYARQDMLDRLAAIVRAREAAA